MGVNVGVSTLAIVHCAGSVRYVATAECSDALSARLAGYVRERCDDVLWPDAVRQVRAMLDDGKLTAAIALYFERTGERWDQEQLELMTLEDGEYWTQETERPIDAGR